MSRLQTVAAWLLPAVIAGVGAVLIWWALIHSKGNNYRV